ncbi:pyridoxamine 5'-phosphate oxidase family protein [Arthrobacter sp. Br18]|uniref:pyridoxamine 5'-phosphate oxidase family protein n=1 Tax=Arthrobacter sp. Br18 TaxID=1312954 RepID=UPI00055E60DB|nr:pyridoxamine 5'-phosphate oxidase family protein [Arthrobacter sp. Br18]
MISPSVDSEYWDAPGLLRASETLSTEECWALATRQTMGRIGFSHDGLLNIFPLNYFVHDNGIYFRASPDGIMARSSLENVAFQADLVNRDTRSGWTILANGPAARIDDPELLTTLWGTHAEEPWAPGQRNAFYGIKPTQIRGRRVHTTN